MTSRTIPPRTPRAGFKIIPSPMGKPAHLSVPVFVQWVEFQAPAQQPVRIRLTDMQGRALTQHELQAVGGTQRLELPMSGRTEGLYLLEVATPLQRKTVKVLKQ